MTTPPFIEKQAKTNLTRIVERIQHQEALPKMRFRTAVRSDSGAITLSHSFDGTLFVDTSGGVATVTLPASTNQAGRIFIVKDTGNAGANNITVNTTGGETIDGSATQTISTNYGVLRIQSNGSNWFLI